MIYHRNEHTDPTFNLPAAHACSLCTVSHVEGKMESMYVHVLKGVGIESIYILKRNFSHLFSTQISFCLLLALVTPAEVIRIMYIYLESFFKEMLCFSL